MMTERTVEDCLREEYFALLPDIRRVANLLEAEVRYSTIPIFLGLDEYERLVVTSRIKECESAIDALRRRQEGATFDSEPQEPYTLTSLNDLAGVRVLVFPRSRMQEIEQLLCKKFSSWDSDPVLGYDDGGEPLALKYYGYCEASDRVRGEFQIVPMLTGLFWEVEHSAIYKPAPKLKSVARALAMRERTCEVLDALRRFEEEFEDLIRKHSPSP
ncbi:MAG: hypothetical protein HY320_04135 [Armatimonadetes bacterium]|nr:hypothetical protein [Armatimonadota bacterium]